jgi:hypothetical protein
MARIEKAQVPQSNLSIKPLPHTQPHHHHSPGREALAISKLSFPPFTNSRHAPTLVLKTQTRRAAPFLYPPANASSLLARSKAWPIAAYALFNGISSHLHRRLAAPPLARRDPTPALPPARSARERQFALVARRQRRQFAGPPATRSSESGRADGAL